VTGETGDRVEAQADAADVRVLEDGSTYTLELVSGPDGGFRITCKVCGQVSDGAECARWRYCPCCRRVHPIPSRRARVSPVLPLP